MAYFEDFSVGDVITTAGVTFTESDIIDFGYRYDPQPFHIDREAAASSRFGGIIASGFHTMAKTFRMLVQTGVFEGGGIASPGFDELRWHQPVRPGDTLHVRYTVLEVHPSKTRDDRGRLLVLYEAVNQADEVVLSFKAIQLFLRRPQDGG